MSEVWPYPEDERMNFFPEPSVAVRCPCDSKATWRVYNRRITKDQYHCDACVPPEGTPRIRRDVHRPDGFWVTPPPPPGIIN